MTTSQIIRIIGDHRLSLQRGDGYWYFVFDDGEKFDTESVMVMRLKDLPLSSWVSQGREFISRMEERQ